MGGGAGEGVLDPKSHVTIIVALSILGVYPHTWDM